MDESDKKSTNGSKVICVGDVMSSELKSDVDSTESSPMSHMSISTSTDGSGTSCTTSPAMQTEIKSLPASKVSSSMTSGKLQKGSGKTRSRGSSPKHIAKSAGTGESPRVSKGKTKSDDVSLGGASSGPPVPLQGGAGEPGSIDMMAKMMAMMAKVDNPVKPGASGKPRGGMPDMSKGGMSDMMAMMANSGMSGMMEMMSKGGAKPDMKAMMSGMHGNASGNPMAKLFDCIIDMSLSRPDSDSSDEDDDDNSPVEIPCQYCSRIFLNQMSLKTHILVAHEHEDSSVLNIKKFVVEKGKQSMKGSRRKQSRDCDKTAAIEAAGVDIEQAESIAKVVSSQEDLSAAESSRGVKRGRKQSDSSGVFESGGAAGGEEDYPHSEHGQSTSSRLCSSGISSSHSSGNSPESRKRSARLRSLRSSSGESTSQVTTKKSRDAFGKQESGSCQKEDSLLVDEPMKITSEIRLTRKSNEDISTESSPRETAKYKKVKEGTKDTSPVTQATVTRGKQISKKDKGVASGLLKMGAEAHSREALQGRHANQKDEQPSDAAETYSSAQEEGSLAAARRTLRSGKSR